jgi:mono/diheme cytochrome c family protein
MFGIKTTLSLAVIVGFMFIWFGVFNVSASDKHWAITNTFLELVRNRSISARAETLKVPNLADTMRIKRGAANYDAMCAQCHLAPGVDSSELYEGLNPKPPILYKDANFANKPNEIFWVIKNGIKMTGMPAWGINNSDEQIWDMIALTSALDNMTATQYKKLVASGKHTHKGDAHGGLDSHDGGHEKSHTSIDAPKEPGVHRNDGHSH